MRKETLLSNSVLPFKQKYKRPVSQEAGLFLYTYIKLISPLLKNKIQYVCLLFILTMNLNHGRILAYVIMQYIFIWTKNSFNAKLTVSHKPTINRPNHMNKTPSLKLCLSIILFLATYFSAMGEDGNTTENTPTAVAQAIEDVRSPEQAPEERNYYIGYR